MWIRIKKDGTAVYVADLVEAFAMLDDGKAEAIDDLPARPESVAEVAPKPKPKGRK